MLPMNTALPWSLLACAISVTNMGTTQMMMKTALASATLLCLSLTAAPLVQADAITEAVSNEHRSSQARARDEYRHPAQTLRFFGIEPDMTVVEIWPGGGWYTDILAPLLSEKGKLYAAHFYVDENTNSYFKNSQAAFKQKLANHPPYKAVTLTAFAPLQATDIAPKGSADAVLTFRNVHNWLMQDGDAGVEAAFKAFHKALKKGGVLGVVEHRMPESFNQDEHKRSGYVKQSYVIEMAKKAGFTLAQSSDINANSRDSANHPRGVWTLPPRLALDDQDRAKYMAIGESDRMTLKFVKE